MEINILKESEKNSFKKTYQDIYTPNKYESELEISALQSFKTETKKITSPIDVTIV